MHRVLALVALVLGLAVTACGGPTSTRPPEPASGPDLSPALAPIAWMTGDWSRDGGQEHWVATAGVLYGVDFRPDGSYQLMIIDDADQGADGKPDGMLRLYAMPGGALPTMFTGTTVTGTNHSPAQVRFANPTHGDPTAITYAVGSAGLIATVTGPGSAQTIAMSPGPASAAPEAEAADLAFAHDTDADGVDGWDRHFADDGAMLRRDTRILGHAAIRAAMAPLLAKASLLWAPAWSRLSPDGNLAVTVGRARIIEHAAVTWRGSYLTLWRHDPAGWLARVDVGRGENPL